MSSCGPRWVSPALDSLRGSTGPQTRCLMFHGQSCLLPQGVRVPLRRLHTVTDAHQLPGVPLLVWLRSAAARMTHRPALPRERVH